MAGSAAAAPAPDALAPADDWMQSLVFADDDSADVESSTLASANVVDLAKDDDDDDDGVDEMANDDDAEAGGAAGGVRNPTRRLATVDVDAVPPAVIDLDSGADDGGLLPMQSGAGAAAPKRAISDAADRPDPKRRVRRFL